LSNNPELHGLLPITLFSESNVLDAVLIEGTKLNGVIDKSICEATQISAVALSGNNFKGSVPSCVWKMQYLKTLRLTSNQLSGELPLKLSNFSASLKEIDLGDNNIGGIQPEWLGENSAQLEAVSVELNKLSCVLPTSSLEWQKSKNFKSLNILSGNLFGCRGLTLPSTSALASDDPAGPSFICADASLLIPAATSIFIVLCPAAIALFLIFCRVVKAEIRRSDSIASKEYAALELAALELKRYASGVLAVAAIGVMVLSPFMYFADSPYTCQYYFRCYFLSCGHSCALF
jgi:hypothetical protein